VSEPEASMTEHTPETSFPGGRLRRCSLFVAAGLVTSVLLSSVAGAIVGPPTIGSPTSASILRTSAVLGGDVTSDNGGAITERGVVFSLTSQNADPLINGSNVTKVTATGTTGVFTVSATGLTGGSGYSFKAYATNGGGTTYTSVNTFTTLNITVASNSNPSRVDEYVTFTADVVGTSTPTGTVTFTIGGTPTAAITLAAVDANTSRATYVANFTSAANSSVFATYSGSPGTDNSATLTQETLNDRTAATATTLAASPNPASPGSSVTFTATLTSGTGSPLGVVNFYSQDSATGFKLLGSQAAAASATNTSTASFSTTSLPSGATTVSANFVANTPWGMSIGETSVTVASLATVTTPTSASVQGTSATLGGTATSDGGSALQQRGVVYSLTSANNNPLLGGTDVFVVSDEGGDCAFPTPCVFTFPVSGLTPGSGYSFKAFATNVMGTAYTSVATFTTTNVPTVTSPAASGISFTSATLGGAVTADGGNALTERGVVYSLTSVNNSPTVEASDGANVFKVAASGTTVDGFTTRVTGLTQGGAYSFRAYATTTAGTGYSNVSTFTTSSISATATSILDTSASLGGTVGSDGGVGISERGVVYSATIANTDPQIGGTDVTRVPATGTTGAFSLPVTGLTAATEYSFAVYVTNSDGTAYSTVGTFTTLTLPTVTTPTSASVTGESAILGGNVTSDGGASITERGVVFSLTSANNDPVINQSGVTRVTASGTTGVFTVAATGLTVASQYTYKAYAINTLGATYTSVATFTTLAVPIVTSPSSASVLGTTATLGGNVTSDSGFAVTERGVVYSLTSANGNPLIGGAGVTKVTASGATGVFTAPITGLAQGSAYSFKAYATNSVGTSYTSVAAFTTLTPPSITSPTSASITTTTASLGGNVTSDNGSAVTERGVVYALTSANNSPEIGGTGVTKTTTTGTTGVFSVPITGLTSGAAYSFKVYATNGVGTGYTAVATFTTLTPPAITSPTSASITATTASLGGNVTSDNGSAITERGVVYALTSANSSPEIGGSGVTKTATTGTTGVFSVPVTGLTNGAAYSFKAYATSLGGTTYTAAATFTTLNAPTLTSATASGASASTVTFDGGVSADGGSTITERGFVYSVTATNSNPAISGTGVTKVTVSGTTGAYSATVSGLTAGTPYSFKAFATSAGGTGYSSTATVTTSNPSLSIGDVSLSEGNSGPQAYSFVVTLSNASSQTITVAHATQNGTAIAGQDFSSATGTLTFTPGQTSQTLGVNVSGDTTAEPDETFTVLLANATNATIVKASGAGIILNDDGGVNPPGISVSAGSVAEGHTGESLISFQVSLSAASSSDVTVSYATSDGTAAAGADYTTTSGSFTVPAGNVSKNVVVVVKGDQAIEPDETLLLTLSNPTGATLLQATAIGTITNDDPVPASATVLQYRLYHDGTKEHLYTTDKNEYNTLGARGWTQEGVAYKMLTSGVYGGVLTIPVFRIYHPGILQHHWTTDLNEARTLSGTPAWFYEATIGYILPTQVTGTVPLFRLSLPNPPLHLYTIDQNEYDTLATRGWVKEGIMGYVVP
jgi:hypothetical protein